MNEEESGKIKKKLHFFTENYDNNSPIKKERKNDNLSG